MKHSSRCPGHVSQSENRNRFHLLALLTRKFCPCELFFFSRCCLVPSKGCLPAISSIRAVIHTPLELRRKKRGAVACWRGPGKLAEEQWAGVRSAAANAHFSDRRPKVSLSRASSGIKWARPRPKPKRNVSPENKLSHEICFIAYDLTRKLLRVPRNL